MPCYDSRTEPDYVRAETKKEFQADLDKLTRMLCEAIEYVDDHVMSKELLAWSQEHRRLDTMRKTNSKGQLRPLKKRLTKKQLARRQDRREGRR